MVEPGEWPEGFRSWSDHLLGRLSINVTPVKVMSSAYRIYSKALRSILIPEKEKNKVLEPDPFPMDESKSPSKNIIHDSLLENEPTSPTVLYSNLSSKLEFINLRECEEGRPGRRRGEEEGTEVIMRQKTELMNRLKDFLCLILSYPSSTLNKDDYEWRIQMVLITNRALRDLEATSKKEEDDFLLIVSGHINWFLGGSRFGKLEPYLSRDMIQMCMNPALGIKFEPNEIMPSINTQTMRVPQEIYALAIDYAVRQMLESIEKDPFKKIGISGRDGKEVMRALKDSPRIRRMFDFVLWVTVSKDRTITDIQEDIIQQLGLGTKGRYISEYSQIWWNFSDKKYLLLLDDVDEKIDLDSLRIPGIASFWLFKKQKVVFTTRSPHVCCAMAVDLEIRMEDHLLPWELFCRNVGQIVHSSTIQPMAVCIVEKCCGHLHAIILMARALKDVTSIVVWGTALFYLSSQSLSMAEGQNEIMVNALAFFWSRKDYFTKLCIKHCVLQTPSYNGISKTWLINHCIANGLIHTHEEGEKLLEDLINASLLMPFEHGGVYMEAHILELLLKFFELDMHARSPKPGGSRLTESTEDEVTIAEEIHLMNSNISELPKSPRCPMLKKMFLQMNHDLTAIPPLFFENMPVLEILDLSNTSIKFLPPSFFKLVTLRELFLRGCELFMELPPQVGELKNLKVFDLEGTEIISLPMDIRNLVNLKCLKVSFYGYINRSKKSDQARAMITQGVISHLSKLCELSIYVNPDDKRWDRVVEDIIKELHSLEQLKVLKLYLPEVKLLDESFLKEMTRLSSTQFRFIVGRHLRRIMSRLPREVEVKFERWNRCLKYVNGEDIPTEVIELLQHTTAFFLDRHSSVTTLSEFGIDSLKNLKLFILAECNKTQTIIDGGKFFKESHDNRDKDEEKVLESLEYLSVHYMKSLMSIWIGPIRKGCLCNLKSLTLQTCPQLTIIFTLDLLGNLNVLEELVIDDCPAIESLVSQESPSEHKLLASASIYFLPKLKKLSLHYLPKLVSISNGLPIAPNLEWMSFYSCPNLKSLSNKEASSTEIMIRGESDWWDALKWNDVEWRNGQPEYLDRVFFPIRRDMDLMTQLATDEDSLQALKQK